MKFYKDSDGAYYIDNVITSPGKYDLAIDTDANCVALINPITKEVRYSGPISGVVDAAGDPYTTVGDLLNVIKGFFANASSDGGGQIIDMQPGEYLMDVLARITDASQEKPYTINFFNHSKTIDWTRFTAKIQWPKWVYLNFVGDINWWPNNYYFQMGFDEGLLSNNPTDKLFLGFSFSRQNDDSLIYKSGLSLNLDTVYLGGLDNNYQEASEYQDLIDDPSAWGETEFNIVRVNGSKDDDVRNDALYKKINGVFIDVTPDFRLANLIGISVKGANFGSANCQGAYFYSANCQGANFGSANCQGAYFYSANCQGAYFYSANCQGAIFGSANLKETYWDSVISIVNANFQNADLTGAQNLPERINTKAKFIAECGAANVNTQTIWIDGTSILS